jgi:hypothetical protein
MFTKWTTHLQDPEEKVRFENQILSARPVLERLSTLLQENEDGLDRVELNVKQFEIPNWAERQAFYNGARSSYHMMKTLIDLDQQDITHDRKLTRPVTGRNTIRPQ